MTDHPIRAEQINTWWSSDIDMRLSGHEWIAKFGLGRNFPIFFTGSSRSEVIAKAEAFRADVIAKHEAAYSARVGALQAARAARSAKSTRAVPDTGKRAVEGKSA
jgi:hypothetical protein